MTTVWREKWHVTVLCDYFNQVFIKSGLLEEFDSYFSPPHGILHKYLQDQEKKYTFENDLGN